MWKMCKLFYVLLKGNIENFCCKNKNEGALQTKFFGAIGLSHNWCSWPIGLSQVQWQFAIGRFGLSVSPLSICFKNLVALLQMVPLTSFNPSWVPPPPCFPLPTSAPDLLIASHLASNHNLSILIWEPVKYCNHNLWGTHLLLADAIKALATSTIPFAFIFWLTDSRGV